MERVFFLLPLAFGLILFPYATNAINVKSLPTKNQTNPIIEKACGNARVKNSCMKTLMAQPGSANADIKTLVFMSLNITKALGATVADSIAQKLEKTDNLGPEIEQALTDCNDQYTDALAQLEDSMVAFFSNAFSDMQTWMSAALTNANTCEESLTEANAVSVLGTKNLDFAQYCSNTLAVINEWAQQQKH